MEHGNDNLLPGPWVDPTRTDPAPWRSADGILKFFEFPVRIPEMSHRAFHLYWQKHHSPNVMNVTGFAQFMRKYNTGHVYPSRVPAVPARYRQDTPFEGAAEVWVNRWQEIGAWLGHPLYTALIQPDEPRFIAQDGRNAILVTREELILETAQDMNENGKTKVYLLVTRRAGMDRMHFHERVSSHASSIVGNAALQRHLCKMVISHRLPDPSPIEGLPATDIDAVIELWFDGLTNLAAFFAEPAYAHDVVPQEDTFVEQARLRAVVAKMRVVHDEFSFQPSVTQPLPFSWQE